MKQNILHELHLTANAVIRPADESDPLLTYGDVPEEYRAAREDCIVLDETDRGSLRVDGGDARDFLHRLLANEVLPLGPGQGNRTLLLSPKGKVLFDMELSALENGGYRLSLPPGDAPSLLQTLDAYLFAEAVEISDDTENHAPLLLLGPRAAERLEQGVGIAAPEGDRVTVEGNFAGGPLRITRLEAHGAPALRVDPGPDRAAELWRCLVRSGARPAGRVVADIVRIEACSAKMHEDIDDGVYPQEARLEDAFSLSKGCYVGQEVVAKIDAYGGVNKLLCALTVSHDDPVPRGTQLSRLDEDTGEWRDLGMVTSWAYSFEADAGRVLAYVKRKHTEVGTVFRIGEGEATLA